MPPEFGPLRAFSFPRATIGNGHVKAADMAEVEVTKLSTAFCLFG